MAKDPEPAQTRTITSIHEIGAPYVQVRYGVVPGVALGIIIAVAIGVVICVVYGVVRGVTLGAILCDH